MAPFLEWLHYFVHAGEENAFMEKSQEVVYDQFPLGYHIDNGL